MQAQFSNSALLGVSRFRITFLFTRKREHPIPGSSFGRCRSGGKPPSPVLRCSCSLLAWLPFPGFRFSQTLADGPSVLDAPTWT